MREPITPSEKKLVDEMESFVAEAINELDPIGLLALDCPSDEYKSEIRDITLRLPMAKGNWLFLGEIMYIVFAYKFDLDDAKPEGKYFQAADKVMRKYQEIINERRAERTKK